MLLLVMAIIARWVVDGEAGVEMASRCETCVLMGREMELLKAKKRRKGAGQVEWIEAMETVCETLLEYKLHREQRGLRRFAKEMSHTMRTLTALRDRGVTVELGYPYEMWQSPAVEVSTMKMQCETMIEQFETSIEGWWNGGQKMFVEAICRETVLRQDDASCVDEEEEKQKEEL